ncbi:WD repeat and FYVE domain-containing protein 3 isoform X2 [Hydra vulgaris]|uniref:WD repeat and FYVE domain-containing protein 3 isoform X2 n=1 Tax=Hydra vulgaris TaxID=6087 RepID=A0ABM4BSJ0_HYDVU
MNFFKNIVIRKARPNEETTAIQKDQGLCIQHLRKLFLEFLHPTGPISVEQQELKQYQMLPVFIKAFSDLPKPNNFSDKFGDVLQFAGHTSKLIVSEVQRRAANKSNLQASKDIIVFLCRNNDESENKGWNLLQTLLILSDGELAIIECMVAATLQSTLVKCLKLFFFLPFNFGSYEKFVEVQKLLVPILVKLCSYPITAKELVRTDDMATLFETLTSSCKSEHMIWRSGISEVLASITRHCFTNGVISYINDKSCIALSLANIEAICNIDPLAVVEMFVTLMCVLKDSADVSNVLMENFSKAHGYKFLKRVLLKFSAQNDEASEQASRNLVLLVSSLVMTGYTPLFPSAAISTPFQRGEYVIPKPTLTSGVSVRNLEAFTVLMQVFLECSNTKLNLQILQAIQSILNSDNANYFIIEPLHPFAQFIQNIPEKDIILKNAVLKLVEFVALHLSWVPSQELVAMTILFKKPDLKSSQCVVLNLLILLINHNALYKTILREAGLMDVMVVALKHYSTSLKDSSDATKLVVDESTTDYLFLLMECVRLLIENNYANTEMFRQHGGARCVHNLIPFDSVRPYALRIIQQLIVDGGNDDLGTLLGLMHSTNVFDLKLKCDVLGSLLYIFQQNPQTRVVFQEVGGFVYVVSVLVSLEGCLAIPPVDLWKDAKCENLLEVIWMVFNVLTCAMKDEPINKLIFMDKIRFKGLIDTVKLLGCFPSNSKVSFKNLLFSSAKIQKGDTVDLPIVEKNGQKYMQLVIFKAILSMGIGIFDSFTLKSEHFLFLQKIPKIIHPASINGLVELLPLFVIDGCQENDILLFVVDQIQYLLNSEVNQQLMCEAGMPLLLLEKCKESFINDEHLLNPLLTKLFERLASQSLHPKVLRKFLRLGYPLCSKSSYAVLRGPEKEISKTKEKDEVDCSMLLEIYDGEIDFLCDEQPTTQNLLEINEFQTIEDDLPSQYSKQNSLDKIEEENIEPDEKISTDENCLNVHIIDEEKPSLVLQDSLDEVDVSIKTAVNRIESLFDAEEKDLGSVKKSNFADELARLCEKFEGRPLPQNLVKSVVSLTTPRDVLSTVPLEPPAFIEFDMNEDGYACLFLPAITPQNVQFTTLSSYRKSISGTSNLPINSSSNGERIFPPTTGLSLSIWLYIATLPDFPNNSSHISLFTVEKHYEEILSKRVVNLSVFQVFLDLLNHRLVISTDDSNCTKANTVMYVKSDEIFELQKWNHICVVLQKNVMRNSTASVYINGKVTFMSKIKYIFQGVPALADVNTCKTLAYIGTHPRHCHVDNIIWRLGPMSIFEEPLNDDTISCINSLGPGYLGCFQAPCLMGVYEEDNIDQKSLISEEKILLSLNPYNLTLTTLFKLFSQCSKSDLELLANEMNINIEDKHTPIQFLTNSSLHLNGPYRPIGFFLIGSAGIRIFCPNQVASSFVSIGGMSILLCLIAMVTQLSELYASLKALTCILQSSKIAKKEMFRIDGYKILAFLLEKKKHLLNTHILHLVFSLIGTVRSDRDSITIPNITAFNDILCNLQIWNNTPGNLEKSLFSHFYELITQGLDQKRNIQCLCKLGCVPKFIHMIQEGDIIEPTLHTIANVLSVLLASSTQTNDLLVVGQYLASTISLSQNEQHINLDNNYEKFSHAYDLKRDIVKRNALLDVFIHLLIFSGQEKDTILFSNQICNILGFDWLLLFFGAKVHKQTVLRGAHILFILLNDSALLNNFQCGLMNGFWLEGCDAITTKNVAAGFNVSEPKHSKELDHEVNHQSYKQKGIPLLTTLLQEHVDLSEIYFLLFSLLLNTNTGFGEFSTRLSMDTFLNIFQSSLNKLKEDRQVYFPDALLILLHLLRKLMSQEKLLYGVPSSIIQIFGYLHDNSSTMASIFCSSSILSALIATLFPIDENKESLDNILEANELLDGGLPADKFSLIDHPCQSLVLSLLTKIFLDQVYQTTGKIQTFTDTIFQSLPSYSTFTQQQKFTTLFASSVLKDFGQFIKINQSKNFDNVRCYTNGIYFVTKIVDRLWLGFFEESYKTIFQFIATLLGKCEEIGLNTDSLYHSMNRVLLYQFAKPGQRLTDQTNLLELLHLLTSCSKVVFSPQNRSPEFITCLTHWLLVVGCVQQCRPSLLFAQESYISEDESSDDGSSLEVVKDNSKNMNQLIANATERAWAVFYSHKKDAIEEVFGVQSSFVSYEAASITPAHLTTLDLSTAEKLLKEQAARCWINFIGNEQKKRNEYLAGPTLTSSKRSSKKWTKSLKKERVLEENISIQETLNWMVVHLRAVKALMKIKSAKVSQEIALVKNSAEKCWSRMELDLIREGGVWGPNHPNILEKWMLDDIEGPCRMRKKLKRNDMFYMHYPYVEQEQDVLFTKNRMPYSHDSKTLYQFCQKYTTRANKSVATPTISNPFSWKPKLYSVDGFEAEDSKEEVNTQTIIQLLEHGEKIYSMYRCARVCGLDSAEGLFLFGRKHFYVIDGFTLMSAEKKGTNTSNQAKEIKDINALPEGSHEPLIPATKGNFMLQRSLSKWSFSDIREVHRRRYLLKDIAIEVFANDGNNHLLVFPKQAARDKVYSRICHVSSVSNNEESIAGMSSDVNLESGQNILSSLMTGERSVTQRWVRGEITNFQYLIYLNTLAGRSYNDLMQYPIMPWILADYTSDYLDLTNPSTFRDLSKPMGAQSEERLFHYRKRFKEWEDPSGKTPAYYYGTHYSSAMIVASYLIRLEPFTQHFLRLQGGHFDLPDRLFHSIKDSWISASHSNMADIKELIPEFFYLPDFLINSNNFDLGTKQSGEVLNHVILPPWAKGDAIEFIRVNREALECDYVSSHLHEWIDLVFGFKQTGSAAVQADNVFHHLFYEKSVDIDEIEDPLERKATIGFINNFGQMPKQLFKRPHPIKRSLRTAEFISQSGTSPVVNSSIEKLFFHYLSNLIPSAVPVKEMKSPIGQIVVSERSIHCTESNKALFPGTQFRLGWGYGDFSLRYYSSDDKLLSVFEDVFVGQTLCVCCLDSSSFVSGGTSTAVCVWNIEQKIKDKGYNLSLQKVLYGHHGKVLSIAFSKPFNIIVSGSTDKSCIIWDMQKLLYTRRLNLPSGSSVNCISINHVTGDIVTCAGTILCVWTVNGELLVQENTSAAISSQILCCAVSEMNVWDEANVIITGAVDGVIKFWGIEFYDSVDSSPDSSARAASEKFLEHQSDVEPDVSSVIKQRSWRRHLVLRHKLTMHTAFNRLDNCEPASVTAIAISKDHRKLFIGDSRGRIYSWSISETVGRIADHWVKDEVADNCRYCKVKFTFAERRHHCRNCGNVFCGKCSRYESPIVHLRIFKAVRVCVDCYVELKRKPSVSFKT